MSNRKQFLLTAKFLRCGDWPKQKQTQQIIPEEKIKNGTPFPSLQTFRYFQGEKNKTQKCN